MSVVSPAVRLGFIQIIACLASGNLFAQSGQPVNSGTTTYDSHLSSVQTASGERWYAWHGYRNSVDSIFVRSTSSQAELRSIVAINPPALAHGPPQIVSCGDASVAVVWSMKSSQGRWQIVLRRLVDNVWGAPVTLSDSRYDAALPSACALDDGSVLVAWSVYVDKAWRICCRSVNQHALSPIVNVSQACAQAFRPALARHNHQTWVFWDQYDGSSYSVYGRTVAPELGSIQQVSPDGKDSLTPVALSHAGTLYVAWLSKSDVVGGPGVVSQMHTLQGAIAGPSGWELIKTPGGDTVAAELTQGLMAIIQPRAVATGGYLGRRTQPMLLAGGDQVWLLWERKSNHRGSTPTVSGDLLGRECRQGRWGPKVVLAQGHVDYHLESSALGDDHQAMLVASDLPKQGIRLYKSFEVSMLDAQPAQQNPWTGWKEISLPIATESTPRHMIDHQGRRLKLYWADLHCHNGLSADAEGKPDEMHFYARDRAGLDVVVFTNNDFYNVPLTQYEFEYGNLLAQTFSDIGSASGGQTFLSLPGFEWTSRIPGTATAKLSDSGNWLPPYRNRSYPNHRSVIYPPSGGPLVHFTEVGNDIARLNEAVAAAGGITLSQHNAFKLSGHAVEVGLELTSGWSNYIAAKPQLFHQSLNEGTRLGFTASGDTHRRAPGLSGALTGIYAEELSADAILDALRDRRCFATSGSRIFMDARAGDAMMGEKTKALGGRIDLSLTAIGTRPVLHAHLVRNGKVIFEVKGSGNKRMEARFEDTELPPGTHWYYWRVKQTGFSGSLPGNLMPAHGPLAWSSPIWVVVE